MKIPRNIGEYQVDMEMLRIPLCPPELKSLYFEKNTEIQAFLLNTKSYLNCIFAVACEEKTGIFHTNSHDIKVV